MPTVIAEVSKLHPFLHSFGRRPLARCCTALLAGLVGPPLLAATPMADPAAALATCRAQAETSARLRCYDAIPLANAATGTHWSGRNSNESFEVTTHGGARLLIEHRDAILVGSIKDAGGTLLQNLHLAGPGELPVTLAEPGTYIVTISATGAWSARLEEGR